MWQSALIRQRRNATNAVPVPSGKPSSNRQRSSRPGASPTSIRHNRDGRFSQEPPRAASRRACATSGSRDSAAGMSPSATAAAKVGTSHNLVSAGSSDRSSAIRHRLSQNAANEAAGGGVREHCPGTRPNAVPAGSQGNSAKFAAGACGTTISLPAIVSEACTGPPLSRHPPWMPPIGQSV